MRHPAAIVCQQSRGKGETRNGALELGGDRVIGQPRDHQRQQIEIERIPVVMRRSLAVAAVGCQLPRNLIDQDSSSNGFAAVARGELGQHSCCYVERQRFAEQMGVGAEVVRQVVLDVRELPVEAQQQIDDPRSLVAGSRFDEQVQRPHPGDRSQCELEHARPVDTGQRRVRVDPACKFRQEPIAIASAVGQPPRAPKHKPVLMPVQLPDDLVVAATGVQKRHVGPETRRGAAIVYGIEVPIDRRRSQ